MKEDRILLLGGGGFLGRALARRLCETGAIIHILGLEAEEPFARNVIIHRASLEDQKTLEGILPRCSTIIHLASSTTPSTSARRPMLELKANIEPTLRFLEVLENYTLERFIYVSSGGTLYGNPQSLPVSEEQALSPISYHGAAKLSLESFLQVFAKQPGRNLVILRPSNIYGPGQPLREGFGVIRTMLEHLRSGTQMEIWGQGNTVRDFLFIDDFVDVCKRFLDHPCESGIYNVGSGEGYSLNEIKVMVERVCKKELRVVHKAERRGDVRSIVLDCSKLRSHLGWQPSVSLEKGIRLTWQWLQNQ